jgi:hypothetical protein
MSKQNDKSLNDIIKFHLDEKNYQARIGKSQNELEVRFATRNIKKISKIDFDNVIKKLKSLNYNCNNELGLHILKIQNEFEDPKTGEIKLSNIRTEINGISNIQEYCRLNSIQKIIEKNPYKTVVNFVSKMYAKDGSNKPIYPIKNNDFNLKISYQTEIQIQNNSKIANKIIEKWSDSKKSFRYMNRITFVHPEFPVKIDLSVTKSSSIGEDYKPILAYNFEDSNILTNPEIYEIEIEVLNNQVGPNTLFNDVDKLERILKKCITHVLSGLQGTNYPITYPEQRDTQEEYLKLIGRDVSKLIGKNGKLKIKTNDFCGPSSFTLQMKNIQPINENDNTPNIRNYYTVTDKADGERKLMFISKNGKIYLINTNMEIQFTGIKAKDKEQYNSLLDGEHILHDKFGNYINLYAAFDIYFIKGNSVRELSFVPLDDTEDKAKYRLPLLISYINKLDFKEGKGIKIINKEFMMDLQGDNIFGCCKQILEKVEKDLYVYNTDGLIFTPIENGVGGNKKGKASDNRKVTWDYSFKWKPPEFNTIDFLVTTKKSENNDDFIGNIFVDGNDLTNENKIKQYKVLELRCGFNEDDHGYINPVNDVINDNIKNKSYYDNEEKYKPVPFYPSDPADNDAHICEIKLINDDAGNKQMCTEEGEVFTDNTIVEFKYDITKSKKERWIPIKVRYDKTTEYRNGGKNYGNAYHVANSNWYSIHNPITIEMLKSGENIPENVQDDDVYYNRTSNKNNTQALRDFHNIVVKKKIITSVSNRGDTLIDYAVGMGGDFPKWIKAKLSFIFGIDVHPDNIENRVRGACARYLDYRKDLSSMPSALFVSGNSGLNIKSGEAIFSEKDKMITKAVFGEGHKNEAKLGKGVFKQYGKGVEGFHISSCQFALHYFFEHKDMLTNFMRNLCECTKVNGYFIGGCYDGNLIFERLKNKKKGEGITLMNEDNSEKIWQIKKQYDNDKLKDDYSSIGLAIEIYQETINKPFKEYLVNFNYLTRIMENYGFVPLDDEDARKMGLPNGTGNFKELYDQLEQDVVRNKSIKKDIKQSLHMSENEKYISFLNKYFVFKKIRNVDAKSVKIEFEEDEIEEDQEVNDKKSEKKGRKIRLVE